MTAPLKELPAEELEAIRERDGRLNWSGQQPKYRTQTQRDRRALLAHVDAVTAERDEIRRLYEELRDADERECGELAQVEAERDALQARVRALDKRISDLEIKCGEVEYGFGP